MKVTKDLKKRVLAASERAVEKIFSDEKRAMRIARVVGQVQKGKQAIDQGQDLILRTLSVAPKADYKALGKSLARIKRRARDLEDKLARMS